MKKKVGTKQYDDKKKLSLRNKFKLFTIGAKVMSENKFYLIFSNIKEKKMYMRKNLSL